MTFENSLDRLTAAIEALTGVLVTMGDKPPTDPVALHAVSTAPATNGAAGPPLVASKRRGRPPKAVPVALPTPPAPNEATVPAAPQEVLPFDDDDLGMDDEYDDALGDSLDGDTPDSPASPSVTAKEAKEAVFAYRDKLIALKGKDQGIATARSLLRQHVQSVDDINDSNAAAIHAAFIGA